MKHPLEEFVAKWRKDVENWRDIIEPLESGEMSTGHIGGPDTPAETIQMREMIARVEADLDRAQEQLRIAPS
jgi:hypothetical protein